MTPVGYRPLPIFHTARRAAELLWLHRWLQLRVVLPGFLMLAVSVALGVHKMAGVPPEKVAEVIQALPTKYAVVWLGLSSGGTILLMMFSVTWRRFLLLDIAPTPLIFNKPFRRYLILFMAGYFAVIIGGLFLSQIALTLLQSVVHDTQLLITLGTICLFASIAAMVLFVTRFVLLFTAATIDNHDLKLRAAPAYIKGNVLRYAATWLLIATTVNIANNLVMLALFSGLGLDQASAIGSIVSGVFTAATMVLTTSLTASLAALAYDFLVHGNGPVTQSIN